MSTAVRNRILFLLFFLSGFCGLLYQVVWLRLAFASFGIITPVLSVVLSVFMLGLAVGSWAAGRWVKPASKRFGVSTIYFYAAAEVIIGLGAFAVPALFRAGEGWLLPLGEMASFRYLLYSALILGGSIVTFCVAMGATFPLMMSFVKEVEEDERHSFSFLYLANVIGASAGTLMTAVVFVELLGFRMTLMLAALMNFGIAAVSVFLGVAHRAKAIPDAPAPELAATGTRLQPTKALLTLAILFMTGFCAMGLEVIWTRAFTPVLHTLVYSFALLLFAYLWGTWIGSWLYRRHIRKGNVIPTARLVAILAVSASLPIVLNDPRLSINNIEAIYSRFRFGGMAVALASIVPFCALLGYLTPKLVDRYSEGFPRGAGKAYAVNVTGCILGPLFVCYVILPALGARLGMVVLGAPFLLVLLVYWRSKGLTGMWRAWAGAASAALLLCSVFVNVSYEEGTPWKGAEVRRDHTATVISYGEGLEKRLLVNGVGITHMTPITKLMAHMPLAIHDDPKSLVVICFGMGTTFRSSMSWGGVKTTAVELVGSVRDAFPFYFSDAAEIMKDPRGRVVIDDGRRFLQRSDEQYDVVTIDPPPPVEASGSSLLYSREFYEIVKKRLKKGGILQHWSPSSDGAAVKAITRALVDAFPHVRAFRSVEGWGIHYVASLEPIDIPSPSKLFARLPETAKRDLGEWLNGDESLAKALFETTLASEVDPKKLMDADANVTITDDRPFNEYYLLRRYLLGAD